MVDTTDTVAFGVSMAHYIILGCAIFSIFWGVLNAALVRKVDLDDLTHVK